MASHTYEESKSIARKTIIILAIVTVVEVLLALLGKGFIIDGFELPLLIMGGIMIILSLYKAYLIIFEFMHMKYEAKGLVRTVLFPLILLVWAVIAFVWEGGYWGQQRASLPQADVKTEINDHSHDAQDDMHQEATHEVDTQHNATEETMENGSEDH